MRAFAVRRFPWGDFVFVAVVGALTALAASVWWISRIVPGMDYPQFLVFVRAFQDVGDPSSPFHGTYAVGHWYMPTALPVLVCSALSHLTGHSIEIAGKVMLTAEYVGDVAASLFLLKELERPRWAVLLLFPLIHSVWTVVGGFFAYSTSIPLVILTWALSVRWLRRRDLLSGIALAACLACVELWHGIGFTQAGFGFAVLWVLWRAPSWRARLVSVLPSFPCLLLFAKWMTTTFADKSVRAPPGWTPPWQAAEDIFEFIEPSVPNYMGRLLALLAILGVGVLLCEVNVGTPRPAQRAWRVGNVGLALSLAYLAGYFALPANMYTVAGVGVRYAYPAALALVFAWNLPGRTAPRAFVLGAMLSYGVWTLRDVQGRFVAFDAETRGASELIDRIWPRDTLYYSPAAEGASKDFAGPTNKPMRELEQYATVRKGGLPNSSFAGYGVNYIRYVHENPMPGLQMQAGWWNESLSKFDWVLVRSTTKLTDSHFVHVDSRPGWDLYGVCGSRRFGPCP
ncbi:MAG TPA: hypothetical protein VGG39_35685 [Polyangiaceae bacterium]|jgi:hypothetical protein